MSTVLHHSLFSEFDIYLFKSGKHYRVHDKLGSHIIEVDGVQGVYFAVWAPNAKHVSVIGNFNYWDKGSHPLATRWDSSGIWEGFIPNIGKGELYKYHVESPSGEHLEKGDPYARFWEVPPSTASIVWDAPYEWKDEKWMKQRKAKAGRPQPYSVYEVHLGSWRKKTGGAESLSYRELAHDLVTYVKELGFTHIEFLPIMEHLYLNGLANRGGPHAAHKATGVLDLITVEGHDDIARLDACLHRRAFGNIGHQRASSGFQTNGIRHVIADILNTHAQPTATGFTKLLQLVDDLRHHGRRHCKTDPDGTAIGR